MAQNNLASKQQEVYLPGNQKHNKQKKYNGNVKILSLKFSKFEKTVVVMGLVFVFAFMIILVSSKVSLGNASNNLHQTISDLNKTHSDNNNLKQQVGELQNSNRLQKIANKNGLSLSNDNVRNVVK
ncbi:cell division protein FtsL [Apilactobacillus xinyiensis]|uniref:cell division protein FtsL n=1 Tax=Apilactobacillus xinyiensis TaxID=2841032 RepID=UPI00200CA365|nr:cell division protein FtsL [Apilactobacillus xinyiensis]MCL0329887.1 cell division protein FtsL [Apilactobacillus xinyiensis]